VDAGCLGACAHLRSTGAAADEGRLRGTAANRALPLEQRTLRRASESPVDRDRKVIPFRANAAPTRTLGLQSGDTNCASTVIHFRPRQHAPRKLTRQMAKNPANSEKPQPKLTMTTVIVCGEPSRGRGVDHAYHRWGLDGEHARQDVVRSASLIRTPQTPPEYAPPHHHLHRTKQPSRKSRAHARAASR
jgi:hypothetical protein